MGGMDGRDDLEYAREILARIADEIISRGTKSEREKLPDSCRLFAVINADSRRRPRG